MPRNRIVVLCPSNVVTGGPEALHQLVDSVNRQGGDAAIMYVPSKMSVPAQYAGYEVRVARQVPDDALVVIPEIWPEKVGQFANTVLWWLSVDFSKPESLLAVPGRHMVQSAYARDFLAGHGIQAQMLTDYVHPVFTDMGLERRKAVAVNPAKGAEWIDKFNARFPDIELVRLQGLTRDQLARTLNEVEVFVDFGHHPGRDRLPREAAACGCTVFVNGVGAGRFVEDYFVDAWFRFSTDDLGSLAGKVRAMFGERDTQPLFVQQVAKQRELFDAQVRGLW